MSKWDIRPSGVQAALKATADAAEPLTKHAKSVGENVEGAAEASGSAVVAGALAGFAGHAGSELKTINARAGAAMRGAAKATRAYLNGDEEMAAAAARAAGRVPEAEFRGQR